MISELSDVEGDGTEEPAQQPAWQSRRTGAGEQAAVLEYGAKIKNETGKTSFKVLKRAAKELGESMTDDVENCGEPVVARLREVLRVIAKAELPGSTRKVLAYRSVEASMRPAEAPTSAKPAAGGSTAIAELEEAVSLVVAAAGRGDVPGITWAKGWLREQGRAQVASRV